MPQALPLPDRISQGAQRTVRQRVLVGQFGDGYFQTAPDGINSIFEEWAVQWENLTSDERNTVSTALLTVGATDYMTWTPPGDSTSKKYQIKPATTAQLYVETCLSGQLFSIQLNLIQVR